MTYSTGYCVRAVLLCALAMGFGWGWRGDYGHEHGAMVPGALVALAACLASTRNDWRRRWPVFALFGAMGWAFGGSMSYGIVLGYTKHVALGSVFYGFCSIFLIGALWGYIGGGFFGLAATLPRRALNHFVAPILAILALWWLERITGLTAWSENWPLLEKWDVDWLAAVSALLVFGAWAMLAPDNTAARLFLVLAAGWCIGFVLLTVLLGLRMTPPRSDNWSGIVGLAAAFYLWLKSRRNHAALRSAGFAGLFGGLGFSTGALFLTFETVYAWPIGGWRLMEHFFGFVMGIGLALGALSLQRNDLAPPAEDGEERALNVPAVLLVMLLVFWLNLPNNWRTWHELFAREAGVTPEEFAPALWAVPFSYWYVLVGLLTTALVLWAAHRHLKAPLPFIPESPAGRGQLLFLYLVWVAALSSLALKVPGLGSTGGMFAQASAAFLALGATALALAVPGATETAVLGRPAEDPRWRFRPLHMLWIPAVLVLMFVWAHVATSTHAEPLGGSQNRFEYSEAE